MKSHPPIPVLKFQDGTYILRDGRAQILDETVLVVSNGRDPEEMRIERPETSILMLPAFRGWPRFILGQPRAPLRFEVSGTYFGAVTLSGSGEASRIQNFWSGHRFPMLAKGMLRHFSMENQGSETAPQWLVDGLLKKRFFVSDKLFDLHAKEEKREPEIEFVRRVMPGFKVSGYGGSDDPHGEIDPYIFTTNSVACIPALEIMRDDAGNGQEWQVQTLDMIPGKTRHPDLGIAIVNFLAQIGVYLESRKSGFSDFPEKWMPEDLLLSPEELELTRLLDEPHPALLPWEELVDWKRSRE